ncbi:helix-turn-helix transcriptional regulator [Glaesserella parasuis]|uniref:helix-turn-helix domain-containing protein n=1 Tax=Glaesserella parasuis TaxID=738 RepID=UPI000DD49A02|nr:helix-turn-helix transcriptional regulator [Glaesserella parasuis]MDG6280432.1 helix-turn-helix transcriptional regulator [Glaesserella parasuis]MDG6282377.1 helix-turn-helix transcriptional regulator [Glaesserella parasuis]MDG6324384.1 helix-turn-helix transcriptional regulator [Glaesserella parasuis]MDO9924970.1 helix-turn-helix transcriptional regulator [Glaesserella parasuis]MDO9932964.1 helix-turn-helix transcriptional regulator [Glaesserella parasuis]
MKLKDRLRASFEAKLLKIVEVSEITGISYSTLQNYLRGVREPNVEILIKFSIHLGINLNWLLTGQGEMFIGGTPESTLTQKEQTLLEDYRESNEQGKAAIEEAASALAATAALTNRKVA